MSVRGPTGLCLHPGCTRKARGHTGMCANHGGWNRRKCKHPDCAASARGTGFCAAHGGWVRRNCQHPDCAASAHCSTGFCAAHCGRRHCQHPDCTRTARGSRFCAAHGGWPPVAHCRARLSGGANRCRNPTPATPAKVSGGGCVWSTLGCVDRWMERPPVHPSRKAHGGGKRCAEEAAQGAGKHARRIVAAAVAVAK